MPLSISAIPRHTGRDRKTVRAYLNGERESGLRDKADEDPFDRVETYVRQRLIDDPHVWATVLFGERHIPWEVDETGMMVGCRSVSGCGL